MASGFSNVKFNFVYCCRASDAIKLELFSLKSIHKKCYVCARFCMSDMWASEIFHQAWFNLIIFAIGYVKIKKKLPVRSNYSLKHLDFIQKLNIWGLWFSKVWIHISIRILWNEVEVLVIGEPQKYWIEFTIRCEPNEKVGISLTEPCKLLRF